MTRRFSPILIVVAVAFALLALVVAARSVRAHGDAACGGAIRCVFNPTTGG